MQEDLDCPRRDWNELGADAVSGQFDTTSRHRRIGDGGGVMRRTLLGLICALFLALSNQPASAFVDSPTISPANPIAGQTVYVVITMGECDAVIYDVQPPPIIREGNTIHILFDSLHEYDGELCFVPVFTTKQAIGTFSAGDYTLQVDREYSGLTGIVTETIATLSFSVAVVGTTSVPALANAGGFTLGALMIVVAMLALRRHAHTAAQRISIPRPVSTPSIEVLLSANPGRHRRNKHDPVIKQ